MKTQHDSRRSSRVLVRLLTLLSVALQSLVVLAQSCVVGTNQSVILYFGSAVHGFPKFGSNIQIGGSWVSMTNSGIKYIICDADPSTICASPGGGDYAFTGGQQSSLAMAFSNFTSAKTLNGSNLPFTRVYSSPYGTDPFVLAVRKMSQGSMPGVWGQVINGGVATMDYDGNGTQDGVRLMDAVIELADTVTPWTEVMAHEIGHTMGLDDCSTCNGTTIMGYSNVQTGPSACDNAKIATTM